MSIVIHDEVNSFDEFQDKIGNENNVAAFAVLREQLIKNIGIDRVKGFLLRYGYELGVQSGKKALNLQFASIEELIRRGPQFHSTYGHVKGILYEIEIELGENNLPKNARGNGIWKGSFEGLEHMAKLGRSEKPVCYTLTGYISGYMSALCNTMIVAREISCIAMGDQVCRWEFKPLEEWGEAIDGEYCHYLESPIIKEFEYTYEQLLEQRNYMYKVANLHKKLTEMITNGSNLQIVAEVANEATGMPIIISDTNFQTYAYCGVSEEQLTTYTSGAKRFLRQQNNNGRAFIVQRKLICCGGHYRLIAPIIVKKKIYGYCAFIYSEKKADLESDYMMLERIANASALYLLNEKTSFDSFERMKGYFLEQLLESQFTSQAEILKRGRFVNIDLNQKFIVAILETTSGPSPFEDEFLFQEQLFDTVNQFFRKRNQTLLSVQKQGKIILLLPLQKKGADHRDC